MLQTQNIPINNQNNPITAVGSPTVRPLTPSDNNPNSASGTANGTVRAHSLLPTVGALNTVLHRGLEEYLGGEGCRDTHLQAGMAVMRASR